MKKEKVIEWLIVISIITIIAVGLATHDHKPKHHKTSTVTQPHK